MVSRRWLREVNDGLDGDGDGDGVGDEEKGVGEGPFIL